jgi:hypothetical protein
MNETLLLENYLSGSLSPEDELLTQARLIIDAELNEKLIWQKRTYDLLREYGRNQLKVEIEKVHTRLFTEKRFESFKEKVKRIFI